MRVDIPDTITWTCHRRKGRGRERTEVRGKAGGEAGGRQGEVCVNDGGERAKAVAMKSGFHFSFSQISISIPL